MFESIEEFKSDIQSLPLSSRMGMLEALRDSVLDEQDVDTVAEQLDAAIMQERYQGFLDGRITARSWEDVKADIRDSL